LVDISTYSVDCANVYSSDLTTQQHQPPRTSTSPVSNDTTKHYSPYSTPHQLPLPFLQAQIITQNMVHICPWIEQMK